MTGVLYHNAQDILSMAVLAAEISDRYSRPPAELADPLEALSLAFIYRDLEQPDRSADAFRTALQGSLPGEERARALEGLAALFKHQRAYDLAVPYWEEWHALDAADPRPCEELAKFYEWKRRDWSAALGWAGCISQAAGQMPSPLRQREIKRLAERRIARLRKKQGGSI
jgi:tetratricopeptide (TPR) repeat protein